MRVHWQKLAHQARKIALTTSTRFSNFGFILIHSHVRGDIISLVVLVDKEWNADLTEFRIFQTPFLALALRPQYAPTSNLAQGLKIGG